MPANLDIGIYRGDDFEKLLRWKDSEGVYMDLTGWTGSSQIRTSENGPVVEEFTVTVHPDQVDLAHRGKVTLTLTSTDTALLVGGTTYSWDLQMTKSSGVVETYIKGTLSIAKDVTRL